MFIDRKTRRFVSAMMLPAMVLYSFTPCLSYGEEVRPTTYGGQSKIENGKLKIENVKTEYRTSNVQHPTSNIQRPTSNVQIKGQTEDWRLQTKDSNLESDSSRSTQYSVPGTDFINSTLNTQHSTLLFPSRSTVNGGFSLRENPYGYSIYYADPETGFCYCQARYYSPELMCFVSRDTFDLPNRYAYCEGDPVNKTDPTGHMTDIDGAIIGNVAALVVGFALSFIFPCSCCCTSLCAKVIWNSLFAAGIGAASGFSGDFAAQLGSGVPFEKVNWGSAGVSAAVGVGCELAGIGIGAFTKWRFKAWRASKNAAHDYAKVPNNPEKGSINSGAPKNAPGRDSGNYLEEQAYSRTKRDFTQLNELIEAHNNLKRNEEKMLSAVRGNATGEQVERFRTSIQTQNRKLQTIRNTPECKAFLRAARTYRNTLEEGTKIRLEITGFIDAATIPNAQIQ